MLCDNLLNARWHSDDWIKAKEPQRQPIPHEEALKTPLPENAPREEFEQREAMINESLAVLKSQRKKLLEYLEFKDSHDGKRCIWLNQMSMPYEDVRPFKKLLEESKKFYLTRTFADATLERLATPQTVAAAAGWFKLIHDPMWIEWQVSGVDDLRMGMLLRSEPGPDGLAIVAYAVIMISGERLCMHDVRKIEIRPESIRISEGKAQLDYEIVRGASDEWVSVGSNYSLRALVMMAYDFVVRLNSPRITDVTPCEDQTKINSKRAKLGRPPLCSYHIVDLNREVKASLKQSEQEVGEGVRFHWRRGHFKCRKTGIFWWNPHTAGRKEHGEVVKDYAA